MEVFSDRMAVADYNKQKKLDVEFTGSTSDSDDYSNDLVADPGNTVDPEVLTNLTTSETVLVDSVQYSLGGAATVKVEVLDSNSNVLASKTSTRSSSGTYTETFTAEDYNGFVENEEFDIKISSDGDNLERVTDSFSGNDVSFSSSSEEVPAFGGGNTVYSFQTVSNISTVDKATPILLVGGDDSTTGNNNIVIDFTNISDAQDIAVYDQNDNLLDYEIEDLDTTNETAVLWCYNSWVRDGTTQAKVAYGDNSANTDRQNVTGTWNNTGQNAAVVQHLQDDPLNATDSTANNNDGTVNGAASTTGQFNNGGTFDGTDDDIVIPNDASLPDNEDFTAIGWMKTTKSGTTTRGDLLNKIGSNDYDGWFLFWDDGKTFDDKAALQVNIDGGFGRIGGTTNVNDGNWHQLSGKWDKSTGDLELYVDGSSEATGSVTGNASSGADLGIGVRVRDDTQRFEGDLDELRVYNDVKDSDWVQADYDASPKAGQVFFSQQAAETTSQTVSAPVSQTSSVTPNPQVNAGTVTVTAPESTVTATSVNPTVFTDEFISAQVSTVNTATPQPAVNAGTATANAPVTQTTSVTPNPTLTVGNTIRAPESVVNVTSPDPQVKGGLEEIIASTSTVNAVTPEPSVQLDQTISARVSIVQAATPQPTVFGDKVVLAGGTSTLTTSTPNPRVLFSNIELTGDTQALITTPDKFAVMNQHTFKEGDLGDSLTATLKDEDGVIDLSSAASVDIVMKDTDGSNLLDAQVTITDAVNGKIRYDWQSGDPIETVGVYQTEFRINQPEGDDTVPNNGYNSVKIEEQVN